MKMKASNFVTCFVISVVAAYASQADQGNSSGDLTRWLSQRVTTSEAYMTQNISPQLPGYKAGFVVAAPWEIPGVQNYKYHWVRDAALVMNTLVTRYISAAPSPKQIYFDKIRDYINFSKENQTALELDDAEKVGLGEVKFNPDGTRYTQWMRPQNDGPALRAITMMRFARQLLREGEVDSVRYLYEGSGTGPNGFDAPGVIQADLNYVSQHWKDLSFDPWEEVKAHHFYTRLVQRKALRDGAELAKILGDRRSARLYKKAAKELEPAVLSHWIAQGQTTPSGGTSSGQIWDTFDRVYGIDYKTSGLDVVEILGALHAHNELDTKDDHFFSPSDDRVLKTAFELSKSFQADFPIAQSDAKQGLGTPIGRYPKDLYNGYDAKHVGNPWYLATAAFAELYYRCAQEWKGAGKISVNSINLEFLSTLTSERLRGGETISATDKRFVILVSSIRELGDSYLRTVKLHEAANGHLNEEFSGDDGSPQGAEDLSWSYASILTAAEHR